jgi:RNA polymerase-associated protein CTR9
MYEALKSTQKALHIDPTDKTTHYNLALVAQSYAQQISDLHQDQINSTSIRRALSCLNCGQRTFRMLINVEEHTLYDKKITEQRERYGETLRVQLDRKLVEQVQYEQEKEARLSLAKKKRDEERAKIKRLEEQNQRQERIEKEKLEENRRRLMEKVREDNLQMASEEMNNDEFEEEKKAKKRGRRRKERDDDEEEEEEQEVKKTKKVK